MRNLSIKIRKSILKIVSATKSAHIASNFSIIELLVFIHKKFKIKSSIDDFILSKGHAALSYYCLLKELKILSQKDLNTYGHNNTKLMSHVSHKVKGIILSTGSLGHGLPVSTGIALAKKIKKNKSKTIVIISDGELDEGSNWESFLFAAHHRLENLIVVLDYNKIQSLDSVKKTINLEPLLSKIKAFNFEVNVVDGHDFSSLKKGFLFKKKNKPKFIIANTIKGKGVSFMENKVEWHYKSPNELDLKKALAEII